MKNTTSTNTQRNELLIVSLSPYFLEKEASWVTAHAEEILRSAKTQAFFQENTLWLERGNSYQLSEILKKLDEMGYERVFEVDSPGEFSQKGGIIDVFAVNMLQAARLDFLGNVLERIDMLPVKVEDEKKARARLEKKLKSQTLFADTKQLKPGDFVTHLDHGVGVFQGTKEVEVDGQVSLFYVVEYAKGDTLFVPKGLERKLARYVGFADPPVSRLGSLLWQRTKRKIREDVEKLAKELLSLYAQKEVARRKPYHFDAEMEHRLALGFAWQETPDQLQAVEDIKKDLSQDRPMDRVVCGDVGFGKTEVALRAAAMAVANGGQAAVICPTTLLARQHFETFTARLKNLPIRVVLLSRLQSPAEQQRILAQIKEGGVDIIVGTHRLLSSDIAFKQLQMLIIDDEQRFGVAQKEKLRQKHPALDLLSLSATPIPRTVYLALSSFKNISLMQTPPHGRRAIETRILPYRASSVAQAINAELSQGGQVYFLHNRVQSMEKMKREISRLVPSAVIDTVHGRMQQRKLVGAMERFASGKSNVLIATTIIENGIDLPQVNTIIVEDASRLGLAQAYQIRGRVGRSDRQGFAYLFHPTRMTPMAKERLDALGEANELGAGYRIAMKDLEMRGAGNILGREQSGSINKVGLNLYCQMLADAVEKMRQ